MRYFHLTKTHSLQQHLSYYCNIPNHYTPFPRHHHHPSTDKDQAMTTSTPHPTNNPIHYEL
ncbi:hypothetical protein ASPTUDRAFT_40337 [Aspergillus tubingensis CBS 134.48]|uniref:Uncharacterized protein n=1 Tax=Aspergillus tubingensis (strain CBS 134.48) TaxID=767770 RepID=A0A1L9NDC5_ASPTC|nr:hypothetical protein ASPTUDRAFT_40337 [Aspergillus tubingensis CBS 134.48]